MNQSWSLSVILTVEELGKDKSSELPKFTSLSFSGLHPENRSSKRQEKDDVMFLGDTDQYVSVDIWIKFGLIPH